MTLLSWHVEFARPLWFALLAALPLWVVYWRRSLVRLSAGRRLFSIALRTSLLAVVATALAGPTATGECNQAMFTAMQLPQPTVAASLPAAALLGPHHVRAGEPFSLDLAMRAESPGKVEIERYRDGQLESTEAVSLLAGENQTRVAAMVRKPGRVVYEVNAGDGKQLGRGYLAPATLAACPIYVDLMPRVLLVDSRAALAEPLQKALAGENVEVDVKPELPADALDRYDLVILSNVPAEAISKAQTASLETYVRARGGGLIAVGGDNSFTAGGYRHTQLEELLPVISEPRPDKPKPTLAMVLVLDISGSMNDPVAPGAKERNIDLAKEALRRAVDMLGPHDQVGVLVFEDASRWIWPLGPATEKEKIKARIDTIEAEGETNMYPPLEKAYLALRESYADIKHIIVTTDGIGSPGDFDGLARKMAAASITMSTVGVGSEPVRPFMQKLAELAKGRAYFCDNGKAIPHIYESDTGVAAKIGITEEPFFPQVVHATQVLCGLDLEKAPTLLGYVETQPKPAAHVVLAAKTGEPILAMWRVGRGAAAAFTSDVTSRWAAPWLNWSGFDRFWVQLVRAVMRRERPQTSRLTAEAADGRLIITLDAVDDEGRFTNGADVRATVETSPLASDSGEGKQRETAHTLSLIQTAPGRYAASQPAGQGTYWLSVDVRRNGHLLQTVRGATAVLDVPPPVHTETSITSIVKPVLRTVLIWPWLLAIALFLLVLDLAMRRTAS